MKASTYTTYAVYTPNIDRIEVPQIRDQQVWEAFYKKLLALDYTAPFHVVLAKYSVFADVDFTVPPSVYSGLYYDLGIDMASDDLYHSEYAALSTGFFQKGVRMIAAAVIADNGQDPNLLTAARQVFGTDNNWEMLSEAVAGQLRTLLSEEEEVEVVPAKVLNEAAVDPFADIPAKEPWEREEEHKAWLSNEILAKISDLIHNEVPVGDPKEEGDCSAYWMTRFEEAMLADANAASSILSYYLEVKVGYQCTIFCPLGYEPYKEMGQRMAESGMVLEAARKVGLLTIGIGHYVSAALSNNDCWDCMFDGVAYLVKDPEFRCLIPFKKRYLAEHLLDMNEAIQEGRVEWWDVYKFYHSKFGDEMRGY